MASALLRSPGLAVAALQGVDASASQRVAPSQRCLQSPGFLGARSGFVRPCTRAAAPAQRIVAAVKAASKDVPTVSDTKTAFLKAYKRPIPSLYSTVIQELLVQQHLMRYNSTYRYDPVFALGFVTVFDQLMDGYRSEPDKEAIFKAYVQALKENPDQYRKDATALENWAKGQAADGIVSLEGQPALQDIAKRAAAKEFHYSRFFAIGLFRILSLAQAVEPETLSKLCAALNISKESVDRDLDVYRGLLTKLTGAKELMREFLDREKKKQLEREADKATKAASPVASSSPE